LDGIKGSRDAAAKHLKRGLVNQQRGVFIRMENNKDAAVTFLKLAAGGKVQEAYSKFAGPGFKHHNPFFEGSASSLQAGMEENARQNPGKVLTVKRAIAEGDFVVVHSHVQQNPDDRGAAVVHIFRFENGRIAELWDIGQPLPEKSPNQYGMF
jgi:predicted SnoaL-like aldol condensation-catalyzing enzyme